MSQLTQYQRMANELRDRVVPKKARQFLKDGYLGEYRTEIVWDCLESTHIAYIKGTKGIISFDYHGSNKFSNLHVGVGPNKIRIEDDDIEVALKLIALLGG